MSRLAALLGGDAGLGSCFEAELGHVDWSYPCAEAAAPAFLSAPSLGSRLKTVA